MVLRTLLFRGLCLAVLTELGASLRRSQLPTKSSDRPSQISQAGIRDTSSSGRRWSPNGWVVKRRARTARAYIDLHIPKTAGTSFAVDVRKALLKGQGFFSQEVCYDRAKSLKQPGDKLVAFVRNPVRHVYSQFLECKYDRWGQSAVKEEDKPVLLNVTTWLQHFKGGKVKDDLNCYHPYNMQTRAFTCKGSCHHLQSEPNVTKAVDNLYTLYFVGLTEYYQASLCLFYSKVRPWAPLPLRCDCTNSTRQGWFNASHVRHKVPEHSVRDLSQTDLELINNLTEYDELLYQHAKARFLHEAAQVERRRGIRIVCDGGNSTEIQPY